MKRFSIFVSLTLALTLLAMSTAQARWGGGYYACKRTPLIHFDGTIAEAVVANPFGNLNTLLTAVLAADPAVLDALSDTHANLTVFAPVDEAFGAIPDQILEYLLIGPDDDADQQPDGGITNVLLYHVVDGHFDPRKIFYVRKKPALVGQDLFVSRGSSNPSVNQSEIACQGVQTSNGLVWLIDSVLLPQFLQ